MYKIHDRMHDLPERLFHTFLSVLPRHDYLTVNVHHSSYIMAYYCLTMHTDRWTLSPWKPDKVLSIVAMCDITCTAIHSNYVLH